MRVRVTKPSGLFWLTPPAPRGAVLDVSPEEGARLVSAGFAEAVPGEPAPVAVPSGEPIPEKKDRAFKGGKRKG